MAASEETQLSWRKSNLSLETNCTEVAFGDDGTTYVRDSKNPHGPTLAFTAGEWDAFIGGVMDGQFDRPRN